MKSKNLDTIPYSSCFRSWYDKASVSIRKGNYPLNYTEEEVFFPPELVPFVLHEICQKRGEAFIRKVLIHHLYAYLDFTEVLEHAVVNQVCYQIARGSLEITLPSEAKLDAYRICVDESYHALRSAEVKQQIQIATGIHPIKVGEPTFLKLLNELEETTDSSIRSFLKVFFVIITETAITGNLLKIPRNKQVVKAVRDLVTEHAQDEKIHSLYFENLLRLIWEQIPLEKRVRIGSILPKLIFIFLKQDVQIIQNYLKILNLNSCEINAILSDTYSESVELHRIKISIEPTLAVLRRNNVLDEVDVTEAFETSGLVLESLD
jgi:hypothetical protein